MPNTYFLIVNSRGREKTGSVAEFAVPVRAAAVVVEAVRAVNVRLACAKSVQEVCAELAALVRAALVVAAGGIEHVSAFSKY